MMQRLFLAITTTVAVGLAAGDAQAVDPTWYAGAGAGVSRLSPDTAGSGFTLKSNTSQAIGGYVGRDLSDRFSLELGFTGLGEAGLSAGQDIGYTALSGGAVYYVLGDTDTIAQRESTGAFVRLGLSRIDNSADIKLEKANSTSIWAGIGVEWPFARRWTLRGELSSFDGDAQMGMLSVYYRLRGKESRRIVVAEQKPSDAAIVTADNRVKAPVPQPSVTPTPPVSVNTDRPAPDTRAPDANEQRRITTPSAPATSTVERGSPSQLAIAPMPLNGVLRGVEFVEGSATFKSVSKGVLDRLANTLLQQSGVVVEIQAHTSALQSDEVSKTVARNRALNTARYLVGKGVPVNRLRARAFGSSQPRASNDTPGGRRLNNRIELQIVR